MDSSRASRGGAIKRYPALLLVVAAALLAVLLPSALTLPQSEPTSLAEFAPVPGTGSAASDMADLSSASGGVGAGVGGPERKTENEPTSLGAPVQRRARLKRCVGDPPRQTEDPLSPPCVAFFDGDNLGDTAKGVSGSEVTVLAPATSSQPHEGRMIDCASAAASDDSGFIQACRSYMRYFNDRYQTYGRSVRLWADHTRSVANSDLRKPFAAASSSINPEWARRSVLSVGYVGALRRTYQDDAPYLVGFRPDFEDQARIAASFVCLKLKGRPARFSGNSTDLVKTRKFGYWGTGLNRERVDLVIAELRSQCDVNVIQVNGATAIQGEQLRGEGVTSVILEVGSGDAARILGSATQIGWFPEWVIPGSNDLSKGIDNNFGARLLDPTQWRHAFGLSMFERRDATVDQPWFRALKEGCSACTEPTVASDGYAVYNLYDNLRMLFWGIQAAGPRLTVQNVDKGLHAIAPRGSPDPYKPAAYFTPGNYTFVKDAAAIWWDPSGPAPGGGVGCYRLPQSGARRRAHEWPSTDADLFDPTSAPCQGDLFKG